jgi:hypothetical protein
VRARFHKSAGDGAADSKQGGSEHDQVIDLDEAQLAQLL